MANLNNIFNPLFLKDKELKIAFELLFFTIKDFDRNISFLLCLESLSKMGVQTESQIEIGFHLNHT